MIEINKKQDCCGCGACVAICPKDCIIMKEDYEGFLYPSVDRELCVNCGACERVCPIMTPLKKAPLEQTAYIVQNKDTKVLRESTAGGAFTAIAKYVLHNNGVVFGAELGRDLVVRHIYVEEENDLFRFRNSKYVQSTIDRSTHRQVKSFLDQGRYVCFSGTPCQIEGLKSYLKQNCENLITVDVVCRAVPSPGIWKKYIEMEEKKVGKIKTVRFRDKALGYQYSTMVVQGENGTEIRGGIDTQPWLRMFFSGMIIRPSCTECPFRSSNRNSDFTIWDCFNSYHLDKKFDECKGTTRMLVHTQKGAAIYEGIKEEFIYSKIDVTLAIRGVDEMVRSPKANSQRKEFFEEYKKNELSEVVAKFFPTTMKLRIKRVVRDSLNKLRLDVVIKRFINR